MHGVGEHKVCGRSVAHDVRVALTVGHTHTRTYGLCFWLATRILMSRFSVILRELAWLPISLVGRRRRQKWGAVYWCVM